MRYYLKSMVLVDDATAKGADGKRLEGAPGMTRIVKNAEVDAKLWQLFGRRGCCLKVFKQPYASLAEATWGPNGVTVVEATIVQNMAAMRELAPRVYGLVKLPDAQGPEGGACHLAQVTDYVEGDYGWSADLRGRLSEFQHEIGFDMRWDMNPKNAVGDLWVDWGFWRMSDPDGYEERLRERATDAADWGSRPEAYQSALGCPSQRDFAHRLGVMGLKPADVRYRTVLDIGCNLGDFVRWAEEHGARRAWGVDLPHVCDAAREVANWCRAWNADFVGMHLPKNVNSAEAVRETTGARAFDVVLALAVDRQVGYGLWMRDLTRREFYLEGHVPDKRETYEDLLVAGWGAGSVEFIGTTRDHGPRPVFKCKR